MSSLIDTVEIDPVWVKQRAAEVRQSSVTVLRNILPVQLVDDWNVAFQPLLNKAIAEEADDPNRGPNRYYVTLPFDEFWANPLVIDNPQIMAVVSELVGSDGTMCQLATDTPIFGSTYQDLHRDTRFPLFPETELEIPPYQLAVNFALVDIDEDSDNGPFEYAPNTHLCSKQEAMRRIDAGETQVKPVFMKRGDVMIRDVRHIHRGTPNRTEIPRPMVVIGYSRQWLFRAEVNLRIPRPVLNTMTERTKQWVRFNPVFETSEEALVKKEEYRAFAY